MQLGQHAAVQISSLTQQAHEIPNGQPPQERPAAEHVVNTAGAATLVPASVRMQAPWRAACTSLAGIATPPASPGLLLNRSMSIGSGLMMQSHPERVGSPMAAQRVGPLLRPSMPMTLVTGPTPPATPPPPGPRALIQAAPLQRSSSLQSLGPVLMPTMLTVAKGPMEAVPPASFLPPAPVHAEVSGLSAATVSAVQISATSEDETSQSDAASAREPRQAYAARLVTPPALVVSCPAATGIPPISGEYLLVPGLRPNGMPLWKLRGGEMWLYFGTNRRWYVGGRDAKDWKFQCQAGFIYSEPEANGASPDRSAGGWARFQNGVFVADPSITVQAAQPARSV